MPLFCFIFTYFDDASFVNSCGIIFANNGDDRIKYFWTQQPKSLCSVLQEKNCGLNFRITLHLSPSLYTLWTLLQTSSNIFMKKYELCWSPSLPTGPNPWKGSGSPPHNVNILRPMLLCRTSWETFCWLVSFFWGVNLLEKKSQTVPQNNQTKLWQWEKIGQDMNHSTKDAVNSPASALARAADRC